MAKYAIKLKKNKEAGKNLCKIFMQDKGQQYPEYE